jgi:hypothetical protein
MTAARVTIADKSTGETLTADEFDQIPLAVNDHADILDSLVDNQIGEPFRAIIGNGTSTSFTVAHGLGRVPDDVSVVQIAGSEEEAVGVKVRRTATQLIIGPFAQAPGVNEYRVVAE